MHQVLDKFSSENGGFISIKSYAIVNARTRCRCAKRAVQRVLHPSTSFRLITPHGDAFYGDGRLLEACRRVCDGTDKGWARVIEARIERRPRKSRGRAIAKTSSSCHRRFRERVIIVEIKTSRSIYKRKVDGVSTIAKNR